MKVEGVLVEIDPHIPEQYQGYIRERNGQIGKDIAELLSLPYRGITNLENTFRNHYLVASKPLDKKTANLFGINSPSDFYGLAIEDLSHVGKAILHPVIGTHTPFYKPDFAERAKRLVLPGVTCFSKEDIAQAYAEKSGNGYDLRFKVANESDGNGQYKIENKDHLDAIANKEHAAVDDGIVLEANLHNPKTITIGITQIGKKKYSFIAHQKNSEQNEEGQSRYLGAVVTVIPGGMEKLLDDISLTSNEKIAAIKAIGFHNLYQEVFKPIASRISYDIVIGLDNQGNKLSGVTDITGRVGGTCPALMVACLELNNNPEIRKVESEVTLNYNPSKALPEETNGQKYIDTQTLKITARINHLVK